jgi:hypothetical protein
MARTKEERLNAIHQEALREFDAIQTAQKDEREQCLQDRRFYSISGAQWEGAIGEQFENKPKFEVNKVHLAVIRIINEYRNNKITVDFKAKGDKGDKLASVLDGLYRANQQDSCADEAYDNAFEEAVGGGIGAWRLRADYEDEEDDENDFQEIRFEPIYDADSCVFFDLNAKRQDKSDAKSCYVISSMTPEQYTEEWGDDPSSWEKGIDDTQYDWSAPDLVYIAEYYKVEYQKESVFTYELLDGSEKRYKQSDFDQDEELERMLEATGATLINEKKVKRKRVHKYILSGGKVLEDCGVIAGKNIPIVPVYGKRWVVDNTERCMGHVRLSKDAQRLKNMQLSKLGELSAYSTVEKPILTPEQIAGHSAMWAQDNIKDYPFLLINPITDASGNKQVAGPAGYTKPPQIPAALAALLQITEQDIKDLLGNQEAGEKMISNISGDAIELIQSRLDMQTYIYVSNFAKAIKRSGEIWLSMAKELYVEYGRNVKILNNDDEQSYVELGKKTMTESGEIEYLNDISKANHDISVGVGPTSQSKKDAIVRSLTNMMQVTSDQETVNILSSLAMMNMDGEGVSNVKKYFRKKLVLSGVLEPTEEEAQQMAAAAQDQQPDANTLYLQAAAQNEAAKAQKAQADTVLTMAKAEESQAKTAETLAGIERDDQEQLIEMVEKMNKAVRGA